jgi:anti-sigma regulatory factor (Ser/Thr protein kinase)
MQSDRAFNQEYPAVASSIPRARSALAMFADATGATPEQVDAVRLAVSEALTNAVLHAYDERGGAIHVSASRSGPELWVRIADDGGAGGAKPSPGLGMGLALIAHMTDHFAMSKRIEGGTEIQMRFGGVGARRRTGLLHAVDSALAA